MSCLKNYNIIYTVVKYILTIKRKINVNLLKFKLMV